MPDCPPALLKAVQSILDAFTELNELPELEAETQHRLDEDGEAFVRCFESDSGLLQLRFIEPEHVRSPVGRQLRPGTQLRDSHRPL